MSRASNSLTHAAALLALILMPLAAQADQILDAEEGKPVSARASSNDLNKVALLDGHRIAKVIGGNDGSIVVTPEPETGVIFVKFQNIGMVGAPKTLYLRDEDGTDYTLILTPQPTPGETILLRVGQATQASKAANIALRHDDEVKRLMAALVNDAIPRDCKSNEKDMTIPLWEGATFVLTRTMQCRAYSAERFRLTSQADGLQVIEQEFYRKGVTAVSVDHQLLNAGESTFVYVVSEGASQ